MQQVILWVVFIIIGIFIGFVVNKVSLIPLTSFFNSNFLLALITFIARLTALIIYYKQKSDMKKDAANIIYIEITNAERIMKQAEKNYKDGNISPSFDNPKDMEKWFDEQGI